MKEMASWFVSSSRRYLASEYPAKILECLDMLNDADIWWRSNEESNSIGNLILHLCGNVRQWIVSGIGGEVDKRDRQGEFDVREGLSKKELSDRLTSTLEEVDAVLGKVDLEQWCSRRMIQGTEVSTFEAIYHVVEHFSMHTGQIAYIAKLRCGRDLGFYDVKDGIATPKWGRGQ